MKVYCKDCKYMPFEAWECNYPDNLEIEYEAYGHNIGNSDSYTKLNIDNNCKWFKPKWHKRKKYKGL